MDDDEVFDFDELSETDEIVNGAIISYVSFGLSQGLLLLLAYLITTFVSPGMYGFISVFTRFQGFASRFIRGIHTGLHRTLPRHNKIVQNSIITSTLPVLVFLWVIMAGLIIVSKDLIIANTLLEPKHQESIILFSIALLPFILLSFVSVVFKVYKSMKISHALWTVGRPLLFIVATALLLSGQVFTLSTFWSVIIALTIVVVLFGFYLLYELEDFTFESIYVDTETVKDYWRYSGYSSISTVFGILQGAISVYIALYLSPITAGVMGLALILGQITRWPLNSVNQIFPQIATKLYDEDKKSLLNQLYKITSLTIMLFSLPILWLYFLFDSSLFGLFSQSYVQYSSIIVLISLGQLLASIFGSVGLLLMMTDNERPTLILQIVLAIVLIPLYFYFTINFGIYGLAGMFLFSLTLNNITELAVLWHLERLFPFTMKHILLSGVSVLLFGLTHLVFTTTIQNILIKISIFIAVVGVYFIISERYILEPKERAFLRSIKNHLQVK